MSRIRIHYCTQCHWLLRAGWYAQELLQTFGEDLEDVREMTSVVRRLSERVAEGLLGTDTPPRSVTLKVRYGDFTTVTRTTALPRPTVDPRRIAEVAIALLDRTDASHRPVRLLGVSLSGFDRGRSHVEGQLELPLRRSA